jgi:uncharacterized membrane protein
MSSKNVADGVEMADDETAGADVPAETSIGLEENVASALAYLFGPITGILVFLLESDNRTVRFNGAQSTVVFGGLVVLSLMTTVLNAFIGIVFGDLLGLLTGLLIFLASTGVGLAAFVLWVYLMVRSYQGKTVRLPVAAGVADGLVD